MRKRVKKEPKRKQAKEKCKERKGLRGRKKETKEQEAGQ